MEYAIATFCYGERYYNQTNRMIESFDYMEVKPQIFIVTDSVDSILERDFVNVKNISEFNTKYMSYHENYYGFDNFGLYEIIWDKPKLFPVAIMRLDDGYTCEKSGSNYILFYKGAYEKALFWSQIIDFNTKEYREEQLKLLLDE
jgi:hypothetical protein